MTALSTRSAASLTLPERNGDDLSTDEGLASALLGAQAVGSFTRTVRRIAGVGRGTVLGSAWITLPDKCQFKTYGLVHLA